MRYRMPLKSKDSKIRKLLDILGCMKPFSELTEMERDVFAEYVNGYFALKGKIEDKQIFELLFKYEFTKEVSERLSTPEVFTA